MGTFSYDTTLKVDFEDRVLAHLQIVIGAKLRRGESFYFSWKDDIAVGDGRTTIWLHPSLPLVYKYHGSKMPRINPEWIHLLTESANTGAGLQLTGEPTAAQLARGGRRVKRINVVYDGQQYSISGRELGDVLAEIASAVASGTPQWLTVNQGGGLPQQAELLLTPGVAIAVLPIPNPDVDPDAETDRSGTQG